MRRVHISGIYTITNIVNGKIYVGQSVSMLARKTQHFNALNKNKHQNYYLQSAVNKYGIENFVFEILEYCDKEFLNSQECYWINMLNVTNQCYGYNLESGNPNGRPKMSEKTKSLLSKRKKGKKFTEEFLNNVINPYWKKVINIETGEIFRTVRAAAKKHSIKFTTLYMRLKSNTMDDVFRYLDEDKIIEKRKSHSKSIIKQISTGRIFNSVVELAEVLNVNYSTLRAQLQKNKLEDFTYISSRKLSQKILYLNSGEVFTTVKEAANHANIEYTKFIKLLKKEALLEYKYFDEYVLKETRNEV